jgi:hypothetical protein
MTSSTHSLEYAIWLPPYAAAKLVAHLSAQLSGKIDVVRASGGFLNFLEFHARNDVVARNRIVSRCVANNQPIPGHSKGPGSQGGSVGRKSEMDKPGPRSIVCCYERSSDIRVFPIEMLALLGRLREQIKRRYIGVLEGRPRSTPQAMRW